MNGKRSGSFAINRLVLQDYSFSSLLYILALEPLLHRLRVVKANLALIGVPLVGRIWARVSAFADDITVFVSRCSDIEAVKKAVARYELVTGAKVSFKKKWSFAVRCLEGWCSRSWTLPLERRSCPHHCGAIRGGRPTEAKLVGRTDKGRHAGGYMDSKALVLKGQGRVVRSVRLLRDP